MRSPISRAAILGLAIVGVAFWFYGGGAFENYLRPIAPDDRLAQEVDEARRRPFRRVRLPGGRSTIR